VHQLTSPSDSFRLRSPATMATSTDDVSLKHSFQQIAPPLATAVASSREDTAFYFQPDAISRALKFNITHLNHTPESHEEALAHLHNAKLYIQRVQSDHSLAAAAAQPSASAAAGNHNAAGTSFSKNYHSHSSAKPLRSMVSSSDGTTALLSSEDSQANSFAVAAHMARDDDDNAQPPAHQQEESIDVYYDTPWWKLIVKRLPWLVALLLLQSFGALILDSYNKLISQHLVLNFFIPMVSIFGQ
jgi:hypothetical protein